MHFVLILISSFGSHVFLQHQCLECTLSHLTVLDLFSFSRSVMAQAMYSSSIKAQLEFKISATRVLRGAQHCGHQGLLMGLHGCNAACGLCFFWSLPHQYMNSLARTHTHTHRESHKEALRFCFSGNWKSIGIHPPWKRVTFSCSLPIIANKLWQRGDWCVGSMQLFGVERRESTKMCLYPRPMLLGGCVYMHVFAWPRAHVTVGRAATGPRGNSLIREAYLPW